MMRVHNTWARGASAIAVPWWPLLAFWGMSMARPRMVLMARSSRSSVVIVLPGFAGGRDGSPYPGGLTALPEDAPAHPGRPTCDLTDRQVVGIVAQSTRT